MADMSPAFFVSSEPDKLRVQSPAIRKEVIQSRTGHDMLEERNRAVLLDYNCGVASNSGQPVAEFLRVAHGGGKRNYGDGCREMDDDFFPHCSPESVGEVVNLVHHDKSKAMKCRGLCIDHVAQHFSRHHDHRRFAIDACVTGQQPNAVSAVPFDKVVKLLIRKGLDRSCVEAFESLGKSEVYRKLPHNCLARSRWCGNQHTAARFECSARLYLKVVQREGIRGLKFRDARTPLPLHCRCISLRGAHHEPRLWARPGRTVTPDEQQSCVARPNGYGKSPEPLAVRKRVLAGTVDDEGVRSRYMHERKPHVGTGEDEAKRPQEPDA